MNKIESFIEKYMPHAEMAEKETGVPALAIMAQAALESGWGEKAIGNNVFGIKRTKNSKMWQEVLTTEYSPKKDKWTGDRVKSVEWIPERNRFKFKILADFEDYPSIADAFLAHSRLLLTERYIGAMEYKKDVKKYLYYIAKAGYATGTAYAEVAAAVAHSISRRLPLKQ